MSLSAANIFFLGLWRPILAFIADPATRFPENQPPDLSAFIALVVAVGGLAALLFLAGIAYRSRFRWLRTGAIAFLAFWYIADLYRLGESAGGLLFRAVHRYDVVWICQIAATVAVLFWLRFSVRRTARFAEASFLILFPLLPCLVANGLWSYATLDKAGFGAGAATATLFPVAPGLPRVIWIVFDELDKGLLFDARPSRLHLPEFDRLRANAMYAERALPAGGETLWSMPSLILGKKIEDIRPDTNRFLIRFSSPGRWVDFSSEPNIFRMAKLAGMNTGVTGWYIPYCRLMGRDLNACSWSPVGSSALCAVYLMKQQSFPRRELYLLRWNVRKLLAFLVPSMLDPVPDNVLSRQYASVRAVQLVRRNAARMLSDPNLNFILIHVPAPHPPGVWNAARHAFDLEHTNSLDNYELSDDILGSIRATLEARGEWNRDAVLVTSDHPFRRALWKAEQVLPPEVASDARFSNRRYVPFLLKMPHQTAPMIYRDEFSSVRAGELLLRSANTSIATDAQAAEWLSARAKSIPADEAAAEPNRSKDFE